MKRCLTPPIIKGLLIKYGERPLFVDRMAQIRKDGDLKPGAVAKGRGHHFIIFVSVPPH